MTILTHPIFLLHDTGRGHPESVSRLVNVLAAVKAAGFQVTEVRAPADQATLRLGHTADQVRSALSWVGRAGEAGEEVPISERSIEAACWAVGAVVEAVDRALGISGLAEDVVWVLARPPGHHATRDRSQGFCVFNNVAIGALHAVAAGIPKVAVLDWDVHHGNGTQDIFWDLPNAMLVSMHQSPLYPDSGEPTERGGHDNIVNVPLAAGSDDADYLVALGGQALPALAQFAPGILLVSAGFDAQQHDPLAGMWVTPAGFGAMARAVREWARARRIPVVFVLEGGYRVETLGACVVACLGS